MADLFDYLLWRGDITFSQMGINPVDALLFATLSYVHFDDVVPGEFGATVTLAEASQLLFEQADTEKRCRVTKDLELLKAAAQTRRYGSVRMTHYRSIFIPEEDTQFAAVAFLPEDGNAYLSFRGTDNTLVGWKEDFNMSFQNTVPAQRLALEFVETFAFVYDMPLYLGGHSKGGNLAIYAAAKCETQIQDRILQIFNHDGPGFGAAMMTDPGYLRIIPKIDSIVPQAAIIGMIMERKESIQVIRSSQFGILQHDPYTWEVMGGDFIRTDALSSDSLFWDRTFTTWLAGMTPEERNEFFDAVFGLLMQENANHPRDVLRPQNLLALVQTFHADENRRNMITNVLQNLLQSAIQSHTPEPQ